MSTDATPRLEAVTVIRVPPPGIEPDYLVAVVKVDGRLQVGRFDGSPEEPPAPGVPVEEVDRRDGTPVYRVRSG